MSTVFTLTDDELAQLGIKANGTYTASDLKVNSLGTYSESNGITYSNDAEEAIDSLTALNYDLVTMDDGDNYHADVTFTDGTSSSNYFLVGSEEGSVLEGYTINENPYSYDESVIELYGYI